MSITEQTQRTCWIVRYCSSCARTWTEETFQKTLFGEDAQTPHITQRPLSKPGPYACVESNWLEGVSFCWDRLRSINPGAKLCCSFLTGWKSWT